MRKEEGSRNEAGSGSRTRSWAPPRAGTWVFSMTPVVLADYHGQTLVRHFADRHGEYVAAPERAAIFTTAQYDVTSTSVRAKSCP